MSDALVPLLLALADDELVLGHRHSEWTGWAPHIEEDVAFSSIAQDEIGHASAYYSIAGKFTGRDPNALAFGREPGEYRHALLCERPNVNWAYTLARHWLYDHADDLRLQSLEGSSNADLASLAKKMRREERYHLLHADMWMKRLAHGPVEARSKLTHALNEAYPDALGLFEPFPEEDQVIKEGLITVPTPDLRERFVADVASTLDAFDLPGAVAPVAEHPAEFVASSSGDLIESDAPTADGDEPNVSLGGRAGKHTPDFDELWTVMTRTFREVPGATW
ncbi:MAG: 1,2-phenylacetyl-CoA epoxidase subunit PaaC [Actinomycetota bacterium]